ncbi:hypothetical protein [Blastopirellula marina]|uniref:Glycosyl hydrolase family 32 N-terminal domain-containing protein n=1 Tax=Blastopirellula marina TaxID=124 RepID=A0A2S8F874_9BACT|nr:hypothetical protein [Blastopirellula marina]PQO28134.1 hypothetical protein C5Y98_24835 [Blastopirellula marina]PTL41674.1 hypothetical protein C5Y97_24850 [Blastopirellula marina]
MRPKRQRIWQSIKPPHSVYVLATFLGLLLANIASAADDPEPLAIDVIIQGTEPSELAPHGEGNVYAPDILLENGTYRMWYGGLGKDGHDRIHYAESKDGIGWKKRGVVLEDKTANHVNDPSVLRVKDRYFMYYTVASAGVTDRIDVATSEDGIKWQRHGTALQAGNPGEWDGLLVGRPSVLFEDGQFKMWYDGRKDLPLGAPDLTAPKSTTSKRSVGYATSKDGLTWTKHAENPVYGNDAGGVHVVRYKTCYLMLFESHGGTMIAESRDGLRWENAQLLVKPSGRPVDKHGHVTPFLLAQEPGKKVLLYVGAAKAATWDRNSIARIPLDADMLNQRITCQSGSAENRVSQENAGATNGSPGIRE